MNRHHQPQITTQYECRRKIWTLIACVRIVQKEKDDGPENVSDELDAGEAVHTVSSTGEEKEEHLLCSQSYARDKPWKRMALEREYLYVKAR